MEITKISKISLLFVVSIILIACGNDNLEKPDPKTYETDVSQEDLNIKEDKGDSEEPIESGEFLLADGYIKMDKYSFTKGSFSLGVKRVLRGDAAEYRIDEEKRDDIKDDKEWVIIELEVYNWGLEGEEKLTFMPDDFKLYNLDEDEKDIKDVGDENDPSRVAAYAGKEEIITLVTQAEEGEDFLIGLDKQAEEKDEEDSENNDSEDENSNNNDEDNSDSNDNESENNDEDDSDNNNNNESEDNSDKNNESEDNNSTENNDESINEDIQEGENDEQGEVSQEDLDTVMYYLTTEDVYELKDFDGTDGDEDKDLEELDDEEKNKEGEKSKETENNKDSENNDSNENNNDSENNNNNGNSQNDENNNDNENVNNSENNE